MTAAAGPGRWRWWRAIVAGCLPPAAGLWLSIPALRPWPADARCVFAPVERCLGLAPASGVLTRLIIWRWPGSRFSRRVQGQA